MNTREKFHSILSFERPDDGGLKWEIGYWAKVMRRWYREGLPHKKGVPEWLNDGRGVDGPIIHTYPELRKNGPSRFYFDHPKKDQDVQEYFALDGPVWKLPINSLYSPPFKEEILEDKESVIIHRNEYGVIVQDQKDQTGFPHWIKTPVESRKDWETLKEERLTLDITSRIPEQFDNYKKVIKNRDFVLGVLGYPCGFYGMCRYLLGEEKVLYSFYDEPDLIKDIIEHLTSLWIKIYDVVLKDLDADAVFIWEDMCFNGGPLISPDMFREFLLPAYKRLTGFFREIGIKHILVDTDGNLTSLIPLFIEGGVTTLYPFEVAAGMDVREVREAFPKLGIIGGIDKRKIAAGKEAIDEELKKVEPVLKKGGYIPTVDHLVSPDISFDNFRYYREKLNTLLRTW